MENKIEDLISMYESLAENPNVENSGSAVYLMVATDLRVLLDEEAFDIVPGDILELGYKNRAEVTHVDGYTLTCVPYRKWSIPRIWRRFRRLIINANRELS
jgi:hypothetical protein